jgi:hypothetical protein
MKYKVALTNHAELDRKRAFEWYRSITLRGMRIDDSTLLAVQWTHWLGTQTGAIQQARAIAFNLRFMN